MKLYKVLNKNCIQDGSFKLLPIRYEDRLDIMKWRNEQIYHLRQSEFLTEKQQDLYFKNVIIPLFQQSKPSQILFSFLKDDICIGYGGLVHINWTDKNAEISFIMNTSHEKESFFNYWSVYLKMIEKIGFDELDLKKLYVYAFDLRPHLYKMLMENNYFLDARLKEHCLFESKFIDVVIHSKIK